MFFAAGAHCVQSSVDVGTQTELRGEWSGRSTGSSQRRKEDSRHCSRRKGESTKRRCSSVRAVFKMTDCFSPSLRPQSCFCELCRRSRMEPSMKVCEQDLWMWRFCQWILLSCVNESSSRSVIIPKGQFVKQSVDIKTKTFHTTITHTKKICK